MEPVNAENQPHRIASLETPQILRREDTEERITAVASWRDAPSFTNAERVALEVVEAVLQK